ncbi:ABC transporter substrate-binding protein [Robertkochia aurantiaca]|uniref:ABC transporter substrate-binding protein n=1 Tax=Robertkochia aurantiaca TaxID=2873700 RepID=UPI001CCC6498|nr:ABC transporter substrate-binding protein [Robertkochia sp. 3YJGBD-33]
MIRKFFPVLFLFIISCKEKPAVNAPQAENPTAALKSNMFAEGFEIIEAAPGLTEIRVYTPWQGAEKTLSYAVADSSYDKPINQKAYDAVLRLPLSKIILTSTTHIPALEALDELNKVVAFPGTRYISSEKARIMIEDGRIADIGANESMNTEAVIDLSPDVIIGFAIDGNNRTYTNLEKIGIPVMYNGDWVEKHPLGKTEWIKVFGVLLDKQEKADSIFKQVAGEYKRVAKLASAVKQSPQVISGAMFKDIWYLPAGNSWAATLFADANADYIWKDAEGSGSLALSLESVLEKGREADYWIGTAQFTSYEEMKDANEHYARFEAFRDQKVYSSSLTTGETGGVIFYELGPHRPDMVLKDLVSILHPELLPGHSPYFFKPLED